MCDNIVSENPFILKNCHDRYNTQERCNKVIDGFLPALRFFSDWFVTNKTIKNFTLLYVQMMAFSF